jgi:MFS family permease
LTGTGPGSSTTLARDEVTLAGYAVLGTWAWFLYGFGAILPLLRAEEGISRSVLGLHSVALAAGGAVSGALTVTLVGLVRRRGCFAIGAVLVCLGMALLVSVHTPTLTIAAAGITGIGGSMLVNTAIPSLSDHHGGSAAAAISEGNAFAAGVGLLAPTAIGLTVGLGWSWRPAALVVVPMAITLLLLVRRVPLGTPAVDGVPGAAAAAGGSLPPLARILLLLVVLCVGIEFCCTAWAADLLRTRTGISQGTASAGVTAVVAGMAIGRLVVGRLALRHSSRRLLLGALALTAVGWLIAWLPTHPAVVLAGFAVIGLGIAGHYPLGAALLYAAAPGQADRATGRLSLGIAVAAGAAPFSLGAVADATSTHTAFIAVPLLVTAATAALAVAVTVGRRSPARLTRTPDPDSEPGCAPG